MRATSTRHHRLATVDVRVREELVTTTTHGGSLSSKQDRWLITRCAFSVSTLCLSYGPLGRCCPPALACVKSTTPRPKPDPITRTRAPTTDTASATAASTPQIVPWYPARVSRRLSSISSAVLSVVRAGVAAYTQPVTSAYTDFHKACTKRLAFNLGMWCTFFRELSGLVMCGWEAMTSPSPLSTFCKVDHALPNSTAS
jgi:hypothetical protein